MKYIKRFNENFEITSKNFDLEQFKSLDTFKKRQQYCNNTLERISSGSSRIVYKINDNMVIKLARSKKGLEQNYNEQNDWIQKQYGHIVASIFDKYYDDKLEGYLWIIMELAKKIDKKRFEEINLISFDKFVHYISDRYYSNRGHHIVAQSHKNQLTSKDIEYIEKDYTETFIEDICGIMADNDLTVGDLSRIVSYGEVDREGYPTVVLVDFGATDSYFEK